MATQTAFERALANMDERSIAQREHAAYNECIQFDGDECGACEDFARMAERDLYNWNYAAFLHNVSTVAKIGEAECIGAHLIARDLTARGERLPLAEGYSPAAVAMSKAACECISCLHHAAHASALAAIDADCACECELAF